MAESTGVPRFDEPNCQAIPAQAPLAVKKWAKMRLMAMPRSPARLATPTGKRTATSHLLTQFFTFRGGGHAMRGPDQAAPLQKILLQLLCQPMLLELCLLGSSRSSRIRSSN